MKTIYLLFICAVCWASAVISQEHPLNKKVTVDYRSKPLIEVLKDLESRTGVQFEYTEGLLDHFGLVTYRAEGQEAGRVASRILRPQGLGLSDFGANRVRVKRFDPWEEFKVKREDVFEFVTPPVVNRQGNEFVISFETKGWCDVTVVVEQEGRIVRHLASGVLGERAPEPFLWRSRKQVLVWDGKNDKGEYLEPGNGLAVRVSLGLKPRFERTLFWSPHKRVAKAPPLIQAAPEGVYVFEGMGVDHLRLFDHEGKYVRAVYPFPAGKLTEVKGLKWVELEPDGYRVPAKADANFYQCTLLTSGDNAQGRLFRREKPPSYGLAGRAAEAMAIRNGFIALLNYSLNRFSTDGGTGEHLLEGPKVAPLQQYGGGSNWRPLQLEVPPRSAALSPDGKWIYMAGFLWDRLAQDPWYDDWRCLHCVLKVSTTGEGGPELFAGSLDEKEDGTDETQFRCATSVACDSSGRVYVSDYMNDRIQVFSPQGKFLATIPVEKPAQVAVHERTGELYVFSWMIANRFRDVQGWNMAARLVRLGPVSAPRQVAVYPLPMTGDARAGAFYKAALDSWTDPPTIWLVADKPYVQPDGWAPFKEESSGFEKAGIRLLVEEAGRLREVLDFASVARKEVGRLTPPRFSRQRLYVNRANSRLYIGEDMGFCKSFKELVEIDPGTGRVQLVPLPFDAEDVAFDLEGHVYLRTRTMICRYDPASWREVPFDYGEEHPSVGTSSGGEGKRAAVVSGIPLHSATLWHHGGMSVSSRGRILACCTVQSDIKEEERRHRVDRTVAMAGKPYSPMIYPGRVLQNKGAIMHVWDAHGRLLREDVVKGLANLNGAYLDASDGIYVMCSSTRMIGGKPYFNTRTGTVMKFPAQGMVVSASERAVVPLPESDRPKRLPDLAQTVGSGMSVAWGEGAEWFYGGAGFDPIKHNYCSCSNSRFCVDHLGRSFVPEVDRYSVAILDAAGNLILRVGKYGNVDDGMPIVREGGPPNPRSVGGDEVALFYPAYVGTDTDRRLFIADIGNSRIVSVRLGYHTEVRIELAERGLWKKEFTSEASAMP